MDSEIKKCPKCGEEMWDNRPQKESGKFKPTAPDFKCKNKACGEAIWPEKKEEVRHMSPEELAREVAILRSFKVKAEGILNEHERKISQLIDFIGTGN